VPLRVVSWFATARVARLVKTSRVLLFSVDTDNHLIANGRRVLGYLTQRRGRAVTFNSL
jgi:hypothetical protein